jgi:hypothetical protein
VSTEERAPAIVPAGSVVLTPKNQSMIEAAVQAREVLDQMMQRVLVLGTDIAIIPGTDKPALTAAGAETIASTLQLRPEFLVAREILPDPAAKVDGVPLLSYSVRCLIYSRETDALLGEGVGACNSWEVKYRYRWEGKGSERKRVENRDVWDLQNTILKMAKKRAFVDAVLVVTGAHRLFTQDVEEELLSMEPATDSQLNWLDDLLAKKTQAQVDELMTRVLGEPVELDALTRPQASLLIDELRPPKDEDDKAGRKGRRRRRRRRTAPSQAGPEPETPAPAPAAPRRTVPPAAMPPDPARTIAVATGQSMTAQQVVERLVRIPLRGGDLDGKTLLDVAAEQGRQALVRIHDSTDDARLRQWCMALADALEPEDERQERLRIAQGGR